MTTTATRPVPERAAQETGPGLREAVAAEWAKLRTARAPRRNLVLGTVLGIGVSLVLAAVVGATFDEWPAAERAQFDPVLFPLSGSLLMAIFFVAASVGSVAPEYSSGMIRLTFTVVPKRWRVLLAKAIVVGAAVGVASAVAVTGMLFGGQAVFASYGLPTAGLGDPDFVRALLVLVLTGPLFPVLSVAVTFLLRSAAASISTMLALIFVPSMFGGLLPGWWQRNVLSLLPGPAGDSLAIGHLEPSALHLHPLAAAVVVVAWVVGLLAVANRAVSRRDA
jgi:ABC-2 type transport system permease protein